jgi:hypothetical protein
MAMQPFKARVRNGRLVLDEPTDLPDGEVVELLPVDVMHEQHSELNEAIDEGIREVDAGLGIEGTPDELMSKVRKAAGLDR